MDEFERGGGFEVELDPGALYSFLDDVGPWADDVLVFPGMVSGGAAPLGGWQGSGEGEVSSFLSARSFFDRNLLHLAPLTASSLRLFRRALKSYITTPSDADVVQSLFVLLPPSLNFISSFDFAAFWTVFAVSCALAEGTCSYLCALSCAGFPAVRDYFPSMFYLGSLLHLPALSILVVDVDFRGSLRSGPTRCTKWG